MQNQGWLIYDGPVPAGGNQSAATEQGRMVAEYMIIQTNVAGINSARNKGISEGKMRKSLEKLSSGYRINRAGDDAAGLAISELMRSQIRGLNQAMRNVNDGISMTHTGDGALTEVHSMLERMKTLAVQSANGTYTTLARTNLNSEVEQLFDELDRIGGTSNFDEIPLFKDTEEKDDLKALETAAREQGRIPKEDDRTENEPHLPRIEPPVKSDDITLQIGHSKGEILDVPRYFLGRHALGLTDVDVTTLDKANASIPYIDAAIEAVSDIRADFGAAENHLEHTHNNLSVTSENMTSAESRIRDTSMADEFTQYTKDNVVFQASMSMCAQANTLPQMVMDLLR